MPKTISELEAQRAQILKEIESKAGNLNKSSKSNNDSSPSLNDWLNAAEEVMPENQPKIGNIPPASKATADNSSSYSSKILKTSHSNTSSSPFFSIIILLTLFLTLVGVIYIVYSTLNKEITEVSSFKEQSTIQINELQTGLDSIQKSMATGGKTELFTEMENQVTDLKSEVASLKAKVAELEAKLANSDSNGVSNAAENSSSSKANVVSTDNQVVTEAILDEKLQQYYQQFEAKIDQKLEILMAALPKEKLQQLQQADIEKSAKEANLETAKNKDIEVATVDIVATPEVNAPELKPVAPIAAPIAPVAPKTPDLTAEAPKSAEPLPKSAEVTWLLEQPKKNYILQLASMPTEAQINRVKEKNALDAKVVSQTRNGITNFILVSGSFDTRAAAQQLATQIKKDKGISPWIRQVEDIAKKLN